MGRGRGCIWRLFILIDYSSLLLFFVVLFFYFVPLGLWIQSIVSLGIGPISIIDLIRMRLRKIPPRLIVDGVINLHKAGLQSISTDMLETHQLAGGHVVNVVSSLIAAAKANIPLTFETTTAIEDEFVEATINNVAININTGADAQAQCVANPSCRGYWEMHSMLHTSACFLLEAGHGRATRFRTPM